MSLAHIDLFVLWEWQVLGDVRVSSDCLCQGSQLHTEFACVHFPAAFGLRNQKQSHADLLRNLTPCFRQ